MPQKPTSTKLKILDSAFQELLERGFVGFTLQRVAGRSRISLGNLTYHYPSREVLIDAMIDRWFGIWQVEFKRIIESKSNDDRFDLAAFIDWVIDTALEENNVRIFTELWAFSNHEPKVARTLDKLYDQAVSVVMRALKVEAKTLKAREIRSLLYVLAVVSEGMSAVLGHSPKNHPERKFIRKQVNQILVPAFEQALKQNP